MVWGIDVRHHTQAQRYTEQMDALLAALPPARPTKLTSALRTLKKSFGDAVYAAALKHITHLDLPAPEARVILRDIFRHHRELTDLLGRDVSLVTAASDYFATRNPVLKTPVLVDSQTLKLNEESAYKDELTGLFNRRYLNQEIPKEMDRFRRFGLLFSVLMLDLNHFKEFNDSYGHQAGDQALKCVAQALMNAARVYDSVIRYGGDEFLMLLPQATRREAMLVANRVHEAMAQQMPSLDGATYVCPSVSIGIATFPMDALDMQSLIGRADHALYRAKIKRNKTAPFRDGKRHFPRFTLSRPLEMFLRRPLAQHIPAMALNMSFCGLLCLAEGHIPVDSPVEVAFTDPVLGQLALKAAVRRVERHDTGRYAIGLSFSIVSAKQRILFWSIIDKNVYAADRRRPANLFQAFPAPTGEAMGRPAAAALQA